AVVLLTVGTNMAFERGMCSSAEPVRLAPTATSASVVSVFCRARRKWKSSGLSAFSGTQAAGASAFRPSRLTGVPAGVVVAPTGRMGAGGLVWADAALTARAASRLAPPQRARDVSIRGLLSHDRHGRAPALP